MSKRTKDERIQSVAGKIAKMAEAQAIKTGKTDIQAVRIGRAKADAYADREMAKPSRRTEI